MFHQFYFVGMQFNTPLGAGLSFTGWSPHLCTDMLGADAQVKQRKDNPLKKINTDEHLIISCD